MRARRALWAFIVAGGGAVAACGGTSDSPFNKSKDGGAGGEGTGGSAAGGKGGSGQSGAGGTAGASGAPGTGGAITLPGEAGPCPAPTAAGVTSICLTLSPEQITARAEPELDKRGILVVEVFNTPNPPKQNAGQVALFQRILPKNAALGGDAGPGPEIGIDELREMRFEGAFPKTVYLRALFVDDRSNLSRKDGQLGSGVWIGGINLDDGFQEGDPLLPVNLTLGQGNAVDLPLTALRRLRATVHLTATPIGDGQGHLDVIALNVADPATTPPKPPPPVFGLASKKCADVKAGDVTVTGLIVGTGPRYITGVLNDLGLQAKFPPGGLVSLDQIGATFAIPNKLVYAPTDYAVNAAFNLNFVIPYDPDAGAIRPNSCADLFPAGDAGP